MKVRVERQAEIFIVTIQRPEVRNAVDRETAEQLVDAFRLFDKDDSFSVAILTGAGGTFCSGADLTAVSELSDDKDRSNELNSDMSRNGPMGPTRLHLSKPVIAAVSGYAVAGGLELALWCDLRVADRDAVFGVFCRRFGVPLIDGGTQRLPRIIGMGRALDLILTGRAVDAEEALSMGLVNRVVAPGNALEASLNLARDISSFPQRCLQNDREAVYQGIHLPLSEGMEREFRLGMDVIESGETESGARRFVRGSGRHGEF